MAWLSRHDWTNSDRLIADMLNSLALDDQNWGGDVNGGGYRLSNVVLDGSGGFQYSLSPVSITQGIDGESRLELRKGSGATSLLRWALVKDATAETGANAGANFAINRYDDAGSFLGTTFGINRATGVVTMGPQHWTGPIDGGGQTVSNITVSGAMVDPTTTKGDLLVRSTTAVTRLGVSTDGMVLTLDSAQALGIKWSAPVGGVPTTRLLTAGTGLSGGGDLSADRSFAVVDDTSIQKARYTKDAAFIAARREVNFVTGANVTLTLADDAANNRVNLTIASAATGVPTTRQVIAGAGLSGGGALSADVTLTAVPMGPSGGSHAAGIVPDPGATAGGTRYLREDATWGIPAGAGGGLTDPTTTLGDLIVRGAAATTRLGVGANGQVLTADSAQTLGVKWAAPTGGGGSQTPWLSNIDANYFTLEKVGLLAIGKASAGWPLDLHHTTDCNLRVAAGSSLGVAGGGIGMQSINDAAVTHQPMRFLASQFTFHAGNVGIGIAPAAPLHVYQSIAGTAAIAIDNDNGAAGYGQAFQFRHGAVGVLGGIYHALRGGIWEMQFKVWTNLAEQQRMVIRGDTGAVGIGTPDPAQRLTIIPSSTPTTVATSYQLSIGENSDNPVFRLQLGYYLDSGTTWTSTIQSLAGGAGARLLLQPSGGAIGVNGNLAPVYALDVIGDVNVTGAFRVNGAALTVGVSSVFGRGGAVAATTGDYTAAMVTNAVSTIGSYADPAWLTSLAYAKITGAPGAGSPQTPWASTINGNSQQLISVAKIGVGTAGPSAELDIVGGLRVSGAPTAPVAANTGMLEFANGAVRLRCLGGSAGAAGRGVFNIFTYDSAGGNILTPFNIIASGNVGLQYNSPTYQLQLGTDSAAKLSTGTWATTSDGRLKQNRRPLTGGVDIVNKLIFEEAEYNGLARTPVGHRVVSVVAQQARLVLPATVIAHPGKFNPDDPEEEETEMLGWNMHEALIHGLLAVQQLDKRLRALEGKPGGAPQARLPYQY